MCYSLAGGRAGTRTCTRCFNHGLAAHLDLLPGFVVSDHDLANVIACYNETNCQEQHGKSKFEKHDVGSDSSQSHGVLLRSKLVVYNDGSGNIV